MKLAVFIGNKNSAPQVYFANEIHHHHKIELLVIEKPKPTQAYASKTKPGSNSFIEKLLKYFLFKIELKKSQKEKRANENVNASHFEKWFKGNHLKINSEIKVLEVEDINSKETENALKALMPDLILDHGTTLVKSHILQTSPLALNLHWGLSPYYRGVNCTARALLNWDIYNVGVTVHKLAVKIDGGEILAQARATITPQDTISGITSQLTYLGTEVMKTAIDKLLKKEELKFKSQNVDDGFLVRKTNWDENIDKFIQNIDEGLLNEMLKKPSRGMVPIITIE